MALALTGFNGILGAGGDVAEDLNLSVGRTRNQLGIRLPGVKTINKGTVSMIIRRISIGSIILFGSATIVKIIFKLISGI